MMNRNLIALAALAAAGVNALGSALVMSRNGNQPVPRAPRPRIISIGIPGMGYGTKVRGNKAVQRAARKARNVKRHRANCRRRAQ